MQKKKKRKLVKVQGRPTKMTTEVVLKLEQAFLIGANDSLACSYAGISRNTFYEYLKKNPNYQDRIDDLRNMPKLKALQTVENKIHDIDTAKWYLERKMKEEFASRTEQTGANGKDLIPEEANNVKELSDKFNEFIKKHS